MTPIKKTPLRRVRRKPRRGRVKGKAMEELRRLCFERDGYRCQGEIVTDLNLRNDMVLRVISYCLRPVNWETGHLAHIGAKRRHGDSLENVRTLCAECHLREHAYGPSGVKPCPPKPRVDA